MSIEIPLDPKDIKDIKDNTPPTVETKKPAEDAKDLNGGMGKVSVVKIDSMTLEQGAKNIDYNTDGFKEAQKKNENEPSQKNANDLKMWTGMLEDSIKAQLERCVEEKIDTDEKMKKVANHIKKLEETGAVYLGEDMEDFYEKKLKPGSAQHIEGIKREVSAKKEARKIEEKYAKIKASRGKGKILAGGDLMADQPAKDMPAEKPGFWKRLKTRVFGSVEQEEEKKEIEAKEYTNKLLEGAEGREKKANYKIKAKADKAAESQTKFDARVTKAAEENITTAKERQAEKEASEATKRLKEAYKETEKGRDKVAERVAKMDAEGQAREANRRLKEAYKETADEAKAQRTKNKAVESQTKFDARVTKAAEENITTAKERQTKKEANPTQKDIEATKEAALEFKANAGETRAQKNIRLGNERVAEAKAQMDREYQDTMDKEIGAGVREAMVAQPGDYLKDAGVPTELNGAIIDGLKKLQQSARTRKGSKLNEQAINELAVSYLQNIVDQYNNSKKTLDKKFGKAEIDQTRKEIIKKAI